MVPLHDLVRILDLEPIEVNLFRGRSPDESRQRVFGGQVAGQALIAASRTVDEPDRGVHSLHAYFLRPGDPNVPILYEVDRIGTGAASAPGASWPSSTARPSSTCRPASTSTNPARTSSARCLPGCPTRRPCPTSRTRMAPYREMLGDFYDRPRPIDLRYVTAHPLERNGQFSDGQTVWLKAADHLPDDPTLHACVVTYASDMTLLDTAVLPFGLNFDSSGMQMASLDHAMWFHRPFRADEWLLYDQHSVSTGSARGLAEGYIFTSDGSLAVSVVQEGLVRWRP
jgi:acyl-CoA thioesterase-2